MAPHQFEKPDPGFDPADNKVVKDHFLNMDGETYILGGGELAPPIEERIQTKLKDFTISAGREPTPEERQIIRQKMYACSGWLEGLKPELEGKKVVPIEAFNRLVYEHEKTIEFVARDRVAYTSRFEARLAECDDEIARLKTELEKCQYVADKDEYRCNTYPASKSIEELLREDLEDVELDELRNAIDAATIKCLANISTASLSVETGRRIQAMADAYAEVAGFVANHSK